MSFRSEPLQIGAVLQEVRSLRANGADQEDILSFLRRRCFSKVVSARILMELEELTLEEAKHAVHFSRAWADTREADERFHEALVEAAKLQEEETSSPPPTPE